MIRFLDLTTRRFDGGATRLRPGHSRVHADAAALKEDGLKKLASAFPCGILIALWLASGIAFFALIFIALFL